MPAKHVAVTPKATATKGLKRGSAAKQVDTGKLLSISAKHSIAHRHT